MGNFNKKHFAIFFIALVLFLAAPKITFADMVTFEVNPLLWIYNILSYGLDLLTSAATVASKAQMFLEWAFKIAAEALKRKLLDMIVDQIVQWIQGGGEPKFITDWPGFFRDAVDQAGGVFIQKIGLSQLCSPFKLQLSAAFIPIPTFTQRTSCTLSAIGVNLNNFLKDFQNGNWIAWQEMVLRPQNNIYGAYLMAWDQYEIEKSAAAKAASAEAQAGKGFLSVKGGCVERNFEGYQSCIDSGLSAEECDKASCIRRGIITPGAAVGDITGKALGSDIDYIVNAQDFAAYVGAIVNALLNRVFAEGVGLLHAGVSTSGGTGNTPQELCAPFSGTPGYANCIAAIGQCVPNAPSYRTCVVAAQCLPLSGTPKYSDCIITEAKCNPLLDTPAYDDCITTKKSGTDILKAQKDFMIFQIDQDLGYHDKLIIALQDNLAVLNQSIEILRKLKDCQRSEPPELAQVQSTASTTISQLASVQSNIIALKSLRAEVVAITDLSQIAPLQARIDREVKPSATQRLVFDTEEDTKGRRTKKISYQQKLDTCIALSGG